MAKQDRELARTLPYTVEYLRLTNRILRAFPGSPHQKSLQAQAETMRASGLHLKPKPNENQP